MSRFAFRYNCDTYNLHAQVCHQDLYLNRWKGSWTIGDGEVSSSVAMDDRRP